LPDDVSMLSCEIAPDGFNARFSAKRKTYCYKLYVSRQRRPLLEPTHEHVVLPLDMRAMRAAAAVIEGEHDFKCFEAAGSVIKNTVRTVYGVDIRIIPLSRASSVFADGAVCEETSDGIANDCVVEISVTGNGFLYNMVRIIAGTLVYCGLGKLCADDVRAAIERGDRTLAGKTLPAKGLHLVSVVY